MIKFVNNNVCLLFLVVITTIDTSRIFYFPLPKIRSSHNELKPVSNGQNSIKTSYEKKLISDEFIPLSAMERNMYKEPQESKNQDTFDWDALVEQQPTEKRFITVNERSPENKNDLDYLMSLDRETRKPMKTKINDEMDAAIDILAERNRNNVVNDEPWNVDTAASRLERLQSNDILNDSEQRKRRNDTLFLVIVGSCSLIGVMGLVAAAIFWYKIQKKAEEALDAEYPQYGVTGPTTSASKISPSSTISDRKLAQSAQMFHYQQQRQQMMAQEKAHLDAKPVHSDESDDEAPAGGDYTVYECPGLAPTGEMEVRNPLFTEPDSSLTPSTSNSQPTTNGHYPQLSTTIPPSSSSQEKSLP